MRKYLIGLSLLAFYFTGMTYAVLDAAAPDDTSITEKPKIDNAVSKWRGGIPLGEDEELLSDDCLSESGGKGKEEVKKIPSMRKLNKQGYKFFITTVQNDSSTDLSVERKGYKLGLELLSQNEVYHLNKRAPKEMGRLVIDDKGGEGLDPLWLVYQLEESDKSVLVARKRGEKVIRILEEASTPQTVALRVGLKRIKAVLPGKISEYKKEEGIMTRLSSWASLPSLPSPPSLTLPSPSLPSPPSLCLPSSLPSLFADDDSSSSSSSSDSSSSNSNSSAPKDGGGDPPGLPEKDGEESPYKGISYDEAMNKLIEEQVD